MTETEIVLIDCDTYIALYIDGKLEDYSDYYNFDFEYGTKIAKKYPNFTFRKVEADIDWLDDYYYSNSGMPENLSDVRTVK